jgi:hypothetical protein
MSRLFLMVVVLCSLSSSLLAEKNGREEGTIVRMRMTDCMAPRHAFMSSMSGATPPAGEQCPEYVLVTDKVVYVISGKSSDQLVPLAESTRFHFQNNEVLIRVDDARKESHFRVKAMVLRPEWDRSQEMEEAEAAAAIVAHRSLEGALLAGTRP